MSTNLCPTVLWISHRRLVVRGDNPKLPMVNLCKGWLWQDAACCTSAGHLWLFYHCNSIPNGRHFHTRWNLSENSRQIHLPRKQSLINRKDIDTRLTKAWTAIDRLSIIWKSDLTDKMKRSFFQAAVILILLYGCTTWTLTKRLKKKLDGNYTRMLRAILNKSWRQHPTRHQLYGYLPPITKTIQVRRTRHAGYCWRCKDGLISDVLLWTPTYGQAKAGRPAQTYIQQLCEDMGCSPEDLPKAMHDWEKWRERVRYICASGTTWWWWWQMVIYTNSPALQSIFSCTFSHFLNKGN